MKKKIIGFLVCILLISLAFVPLNRAIKIQTNNPDSAQICLENIDVPTWDRGTTWTYQVDDIILNEENFNINIKLDKFSVKVVSVSGSSYNTEFSTKINGNFYIDYAPYKIELNLLYTTLKGHIFQRKSDLGIEKINFQLYSMFTVKIIEPTQLPTIPIFIMIKFDSDVNPPYQLLPFPINIGNKWGLTPMQLSFDATIKSPWFRLIHAVNGIIRFFGLVPEEFQDLSDLIADNLPIFRSNELIEINETLGDYNLFICVNKETVTVGAGTFEVYNISFLGDFGEFGYFCYAPSVGKIIKIFGYIKEFVTSSEDVNIELVNYKSV